MKLSLSLALCAPISIALLLIPTSGYNFDNGGERVLAGKSKGKGKSKGGKCLKSWYTKSIFSSSNNVMHSFRDEISKEQDGEVIGFSSGTCAYMPNDEEFCSITFKFINGGELATQGVFDDDGTLIVVGAKGGYKDKGHVAADVISYDPAFEAKWTLTTY